MMALRLGLAITGLALFPGLAEAHKLKLYAMAAGLEISGYGFFVGGGRAPAARLEIRDSVGLVVHASQTGPEGRFAWNAPRAGDYRVSINTGDGHLAQITLAAGMPAAEALPPEAVAQAVQRQLIPVLERLEQIEERRRLTDIFAGFSFILGAVGIGMWLAARRQGPLAGGPVLGIAPSEGSGQPDVARQTGRPEHDPHHHHHGR